MAPQLVPDTPLDEIFDIHKSVKRAFRTGKLRSVDFRRAQLAQLAYLLQDNYQEFEDALFQDFGKHPVEVIMGEVTVVFERTLEAIKNLDKWTADVDLSSETNTRFAGWKPTLIKQPIGPVLIIGPFNGPILLTLQPLMGAIAAGCPAVIKPSELCLHCSSLLSRLVHQYLDRECYHMVLGGSEHSTRLLELKWGSIVFTGGIKVGRIVAAAAAKFMTPVTLELGGKCPVVIDGGYDMDLAARRILWGKIINAGQICVSPDYILVPRDRQDALVAGLQKAWHEFFPNGSLASTDLGNMINKMHFHRVEDILKRTSGHIVLGGQKDPAKLRMEITIVRDVQAGDALLEEEIFGPVLAIVPTNSMEEAVEFITEGPEPLTVYLFSSNESVKQYVRENTASGSFVLNDTMTQLMIPELPVGGIGASGYGYQGGKYAFDTFVQNRPSIDVPTEAETHIAIRYPPYTKQSYDVMCAALFQPIPIPRAQKLSRRDKQALEGRTSNRDLW